MARSSGVMEGELLHRRGLARPDPKREATSRGRLTKARAVMLVPHAGLNAAMRQVSLWGPVLMHQLPALGDKALVNLRATAAKERG